MLALLALVVTVAVVDSLNPSTLGPALLLALGRNGARDVALFTLGVFLVSTVGGLVLLLGPGQALLHLVSKPSPHTVHLLEVAAGVLLVAAGVVLWLSRAGVRRRLTDEGRKGIGGRSAFFLGAGIMAAELPTAFPYIAALVAIVGAHRSLLEGTLLVLTYNVLFVVPLLAVLVAVAAGGRRGAELARKARTGLERHGAELIPIALTLLGLAILAVGVVGLV